MDNQDRKLQALELSLVRGKHGLLLHRILEKKYNAFTRGAVPPIAPERFVLYHNDIRKLNYVCRAICRRTGREKTLLHLLEAFGADVQTCAYGRLELGIARFYDLLQKPTNTPLEVTEFILTGWPLIEQLITQYIDELSERITLDI